MFFQITIRWSNYIYPLIVVQIGKDNRHEQYKIYNPMSPEKYIVIQNNRPFLLGKGLKKRRWDWEVLEGEITYRQALEHAIAAIERQLNPATEPKRSVDSDRITYNQYHKSRREYFRDQMPDWGANKRKNGNQ